MSKEPAIKTEVLLITPDWAAARLKDLQTAVEKGLFRQRNPRQRNIQRYVQDMKAGKWILTHQGLAFDVNGYLVDGQNRLWAVVQSGCSVYMTVTYNLPPECMDALDLGAARTVANVLQISHGYKPIEANEYATAARQIINMNVLATGEPVKKAKFDVMVQVSTQEVLYVLEQLGFKSELDRFATLVPKRKDRRAPFAGPWCWYHTVRPKIAERLAREYATLEELPKGSPVLSLFRYYQTPRRGKHQAEQMMVVANVIEHYEKGESIGALTPSREALRWLIRQNPPLAEKVLKCAKG